VVIIDMSIEAVFILHGSATSGTNKWATCLTMQIGDMLLEAVQMVELLVTYCATQQCTFTTNCNNKATLYIVLAVILISLFCRNNRLLNKFDN
jgi:hypothetical protein